MLTIIIFLLILSVLVLVHELGHYFAARAFGVKADEFGYGFPPRLFGLVRVDGKWKFVSSRDNHAYKNTVWSLNWLPLGGFVRLKGEEGDGKDGTDSFVSKKPYKRLIIIAAGVAMNWLLTACIFSGGFMFGVPAQLESLPADARVRNEQVQMTDVMASSPAEKAGILPGDYLISVQGQPVTKMADAKDRLAEASKNLKPYSVTVEQDGARKDLFVTPVFLSEIQRPGIGISMADVGIVQFPFFQAIGQGFRVAWGYTETIAVSLYGLVRDLFVQHRLTSEVSGPVGIAVVTYRIVHQGVWNILQFTALLSLNLAVINFFPIPALDGGRAVLIVMEWLRRKKIHPKFEANLHRIGFALLMILIVLVTVHDVRQYGGVIVGGIRHIVGM